MHNKHTKLLILGVLLFMLASIILAACARPGTASDEQANTNQSNGNTGVAGGTNSGPATVHMNDSNFVQQTVTVSKGATLKLVNDSASLHVIQNGSWENGSAQNTAESGAPKVNQLTFQANDNHDIGPFNTAGTFKYYCTVHPGMNLTVTVQ